MIRRHGKRMARIPAIAAILLASAATMAQASRPLPDYETVKSEHRPSELVVLDRYGREIASLRQDYSERRGQWVALEDISPALQRAVLLSEDRHFHHHGGVDWQATMAAGWNWVWGGSHRRGASTISMQLVGMLDPALQRPAAGRSVAQKVSQMRRARELEESWSKEQILEAYLNRVAFRGELRGIAAVSRVMFGKHPHGLDAGEAAVAAALLRGPNADHYRVATRACAVLVEMAYAASCERLPYLTEQWLNNTARPAADRPALAPHFARMAAAGVRPLETKEPMRTTLDADLQMVVTAGVQRHLAGMGRSQLTDAAVVVMDNPSGEILAYVGSSGSASSAALVDHAAARRQAGSTLKPFLYAQALERRYLTAASLLDDAALDVSTAGGLYVPQNYDRNYAGLVSVRHALAASLNIPAVRVLMLLGPERFTQKLRSLGLPLEHGSDHYGYSLALGSADVDLLSLTNAYRALADGGRWSEPILLLKEAGASPVKKVVFDPMASWLVGDILADRRARAGSFGLESVLATRFWSAVKTGTSKDMRDNWTIGWSDQYTVGVWVGNSQGLSMRDVSGVSGAAPIWHEVISTLHQNRQSRRPAPPQGLLRQEVEFGAGLEAKRLEYFLPGTALRKVETVRNEGLSQARILSPADATVIAYDPDMPSANQRVLLRTAGDQELGCDLRWEVNGVPVGQGAQSLWPPKPGRWRITLLGPEDTVLDEISLQVRGLPLSAAQAHKLPISQR